MPFPSPFFSIFLSEGVPRCLVQGIMILHALPDCFWRVIFLICIFFTLILMLSLPMKLSTSIPFPATILIPGLSKLLNSIAIFKCFVRVLILPLYSKLQVIKTFSSSHDCSHGRLSSWHSWMMIMDRNEWTTAVWHFSSLIISSSVVDINFKFDVNVLWSYLTPTQTD